MILNKVNKKLYDNLILNKDKYYYEFDKNFHKVRYEKTFKILKKFLKNNGKFLDIGCGYGFILKKIAKEYKKIELYGVDVKPGIKNYLNKNVNFLLADCYSLPFENEQFDYVALFEVVEHLYNPLYALREVNRVLKPGGLLFISTPNLTRFAVLFSLILNKSPFKDIKNFEINGASHLREFSCEELKELLFLSNFSTEYFEYFDYNAIYDSIKKAIAKNIIHIFSFFFKKRRECIFIVAKKI